MSQRLRYVKGGVKVTIGMQATIEIPSPRGVPKVEWLHVAPAGKAATSSSCEVGEKQKLMLAWSISGAFDELRLQPGNLSIPVGKTDIEVTAPSTGGDPKREVRYELTASQKQKHGTLIASSADAQVTVVRRPTPKIVSFSARAPPKDGKESEEQLIDLGIPDGTDVIFSWEVENADVVVLKTDQGEVFRSKDLKREATVRPPQGATTQYWLSAENPTGDQQQGIWVKSGRGFFINISNEMGLWHKQVTVFERAALSIEASTALKLTGVFDVLDIAEPHSEQELMEPLVAALRSAYGEVDDFLSLDASNWTIEYVGGNPELTPATDAEKASIELKYDWTWKLAKGKFEAEGQLQAVVFAVEKTYRLGAPKAQKMEPKFLQGVAEISKTIAVSPEIVVKPGKVLCKGLGVKASIALTVKPNWEVILKWLAKRATLAAEATGVELGLIGLGSVAVTGTVLLWLAMAYEIDAIEGLASLRPKADEIADELWQAYWKGVRTPEESFDATSEPARKAHAEGQRRGRLVRKGVREAFGEISDADFEAACTAGLPDSFAKIETDLRNDMIKNLFLPQAKIFVWKKYVEEYAHPTFGSAAQRRREGWGSLFGDYPRSGEALCKVYYYGDPDLKDSMKGPLE